MSFRNIYAVWITSSCDSLLKHLITTMLFYVFYRAKARQIKDYTRKAKGRTPTFAFDAVSAFA